MDPGEGWMVFVRRFRLISLSDEDGPESGGEGFNGCCREDGVAPWRSVTFAVEKFRPCGDGLIEIRTSDGDLAGLIWEIVFVGPTKGC